MIGIYPEDHGAAADGVTDDSTALETAYAAAASARVPMVLSDSHYLFTRKQVWDQEVDVIGRNPNSCKLIKDGNFDGIEISGAAQESRFEDFSVLGASGNGGRGIVVLAAAHSAMRRVKIINHCGHGLHLTAGAPIGFCAEYSNLTISGNGGDGVRVENHWNSFFYNIDSRSNAGHGFNLVQGDYHTGNQIVCQHNGGDGFKISALQNTFLNVYGEGNAYADLHLTSGTRRNMVLILGSEGNTKIVDLGPDNTVLDTAVFGTLSVPDISRLRRTTNVNGLPLTIHGGRSGEGPNPTKGGSVTIYGGESRGTGNMAGGEVYVDGGDGSGSGGVGTVHLQTTGNGGVVIGSSNAAGPSVGLQFDSATRVLRLPRLSTAQRDALTPSDGMLIFNTSSGRPQFYCSGWVGL